jgi:hypothetical protein
VSNAKKEIDLTELGAAQLLQKETEKTREAAIYDVLKDFQDEKKQKMLSELNDTQISLITRLKVLSKLRKQPIYENVCELFMILKASKNRKSRAEVVKAIKAANPEPRMDNQFDKVRQALS